MVRTNKMNSNAAALLTMKTVQLGDDNITGLCRTAVQKLVRLF